MTDFTIEKIDILRGIITEYKTEIILKAIRKCMSIKYMCDISDFTIEEIEKISENIKD